MNIGPRKPEPGPSPTQRGLVLQPIIATEDIGRNHNFHVSEDHLNPHNISVAKKDLADYGR